MHNPFAIPYSVCYSVFCVLVLPIQGLSPPRRLGPITEVKNGKSSTCSYHRASLFLASLPDSPPILLCTWEGSLGMRLGCSRTAHLQPYNMRCKAVSEVVRNVALPLLK